MTSQQFANDVLATLRQHLYLGEVSFFGSWHAGDADEYSDVDIRARVHQRMDQEFFDSLIECMRGRFGRLTVRYDPDYMHDTRAQDLRFTLHEFPIYWRNDLVVSSDVESPQKFPDPFSEWSVATSALWNLVWAVKYARRGKPRTSDEYVEAACDKLQTERVGFSRDGLEALLTVLARKDVDAELITKL